MVLDFFDSQKWRCLLVDDKPIYPLLVKYFYAGMVFTHKTHILKSRVKGKDIILNDSTLAKILNIPCEGWGVQSLSNWSSYPISLAEQTRIIMSDNSIQSHYVPYIDQLPALSRILHHLCFYNVFPRDPLLLKVNEQNMFFISML